MTVELLPWHKIFRKNQLARKKQSEPPPTIHKVLTRLMLETITISNTCVMLTARTFLSNPVTLHRHTLPLCFVFHRWLQVN